MMHLLPNNHKKDDTEITTFVLQSLTRQSEQLPAPLPEHPEQILLWQGRFAASPEQILLWQDGFAASPEQILLWQGGFAASPEPASHSIAPVQPFLSACCSWHNQRPTLTPSRAKSHPSHKSSTGEGGSQQSLCMLFRFSKAISR